MIGLLIILYALPGIAIGREFAGYVLYLEGHGKHPPDNNDKAWAFTAFVTAFVLWPVFLVGWLWNHHAQAVLPKSPEVKRNLDQLRKRELERITRENERRSQELGVGVGVVVRDEYGRRVSLPPSVAVDPEEARRQAHDDDDRDGMICT